MQGIRQGQTQDTRAVQACTRVQCAPSLLVLRLAGRADLVLLCGDPGLALVVRELDLHVKKLKETTTTANDVNRRGG